MAIEADIPDEDAPPLARKAGPRLSSDDAAAANRANRWPITICIMGATTMVVLDQTIANVALPHIQGGLSASQDQITWVLTSYIVASALALPMAGWLTARLGARRLLLISVALFTISSALCGFAQNLPEIVIFRVIQGATGASLMPLSQSLMYDIHPPEQRAQSMAVWGMGIMAAPMLGPVLGGWLTENWSWRWVFFINVPIGIASILGLLAFLSQPNNNERRPFDGLGYGFIICFIGGLQLVLDRGQSAGWLDSREIWTEIIICGLGLYLFTIHSLTAKHPFFHPAVMGNTRLLTTAFLGSVITAAMMSATALQPIMVQRLLGYSVLQAGLIAAPRGVGMLIGMQMANILVQRVDARILMVIGIISTAISMLMMSQFSLQMDAGPLIITGIIGGLGGPLVFMPVSLLALGALGPESRTEGATLFNLFRNLGSSLGIAIVAAMQVRDAQAARDRLAEHITPDNPIIGAYMPQALQTAEGIARLRGMAAQQAEMISYVSIFGLLGIICALCTPLIFFMKPSAPPTGPAQNTPMSE